MSDHFKVCSGCNKVWHTQERFISDCDLELNGYKANFEKLENGLFFFSHKQDGCHSSITTEVNDFMNLYSGPFYTDRKIGTEDCPDHCRNIEQLDRCEALCECAFVREILNHIRERQAIEGRRSILRNKIQKL